jgi:transmembrane sensor
MVRLQSGHATPEDQHGFADWQRSDARNQQAWARLQQTIGKPVATLRAVDSRLPGQARDARETLLRPARRIFIRGLAIAATAGGALALVDRMQPLASFTADLRTGTGERRTLTLADGSVLTLNARTLVDVGFVDGQRQLFLRQGEIVVQVARDPLRPFIVATRDGSVRALGTRFVVAQETDRSRVSVLEHRVELRTVQGSRRVLRDGEGAWFGTDRITLIDAPLVAGDDWTRGLLVVNRQPLSWVVEELQQYRRGLIRLSPEVAEVPVQGVFPLSDVDRALSALAETLPIRVARYGPWLTNIGAP